MEKDVLIRVTGLQLQSGEESDPIEIVVPGSYDFRNGCHYLQYEEIMDETGIPTVNHVKLSPASMEVRKTGIVNVHMVFEKGKKNMAFYTTPYGTLEMGISATGLSLTEEDEKLDARVEYALDMNNEYVADCCLQIRVENKDRRVFSL